MRSFFYPTTHVYGSERLWLVALGLAIYTAWYILSAVPITQPELFGDRSTAAFDLWSIQHAMSGMQLAAILCWGLGHPEDKWSHTRSPQILGIVMILAFGWEYVEFLGEVESFGEAVGGWLRGNEHWSNHLIGDPLCVYLGGLLYTRLPSIPRQVLLWTSVWLTAAWVIVNGFQDHCMVVQEYLLGVS